MDSIHLEGSDEHGGRVVNGTTINGTVAGLNQTSAEDTPVGTSSLVLVGIVVNYMYAKITITKTNLNHLSIPAGNKVHDVNDNAANVNYGEGWDMRFVKQSSKPPPGHTFHSTANPGSRVDFAFTGMSHSSLGSAF